MVEVVEDQRSRWEVVELGEEVKKSYVRDAEHSRKFFVSPLSKKFCLAILVKYISVQFPNSTAQQKYPN